MFCANLILLAHSAIPHHHHDGIAVDIIRSVEKHHASHTENHHHTPHTENHHHHNEDPLSENCLLNSTFFISVANRHKDGIIVDYTYLLYPTIATMTDSSNKVILQGKRIRHRPYRFSYQSFLVTLPYELRAPPIC